MRNIILTIILTGVFLFVACVPAVAQEAQAIAVLKSDAPFAEKSEACRTLVREGGPEAVAALAPLLTDAELSHMARLALQAMPCRQAVDALRNALDTTSGDLKAGVINSLADRKDAQATPKLIALLGDSDEAVAQAAARALGVIAPAGAAEALINALSQPDVSAGNLLAFCDGLMGLAERRAAAAQESEAAAIYDRVLAVADAPGQVRTGALRGAVLARGPEACTPVLLEGLRSEDKALFLGAVRASRELGGGEAVTETLATVLPDLSAERKVRLMQVLGQRGGSAAGPALLAEAKDGTAEVRVAALKALTRSAYAPALALMEDLACNGEGELAQAAQDSLSYFPGEEGDAVLRAMLESGDPKVRLVAVELVGKGGLPEPEGLLMAVAKGGETEEVRVAALEALSTHAGMAEMPGLLDLLLAEGSAGEMKAVEAALRALCTRQKRGTGTVTVKEAVYGALPDGPSKDVTEKVKQLVESGALSVDASNANFGDTAPGLVKHLRVSYEVNGTPMTKTAAENQTLALGAAVAPAALVDAFCSALDRAEGERKLALLRLLGNTESGKALEVIRTAAFEGEGAVKDTALRQFCGWPSDEVLPALMDLALNATDTTVKGLAMEGAVRLLKQSRAGAAEVLRQYASLMEHAQSSDEKKLVLSGLAQVPSIEAFEMVLQEFGGESVNAEARQAAIAIAKELGKAAREDTGFFNGTDLSGWEGNQAYWRVKDGAVTGRSRKPIPRNEFLWSGVEVRDFYLAVDVQLDPNSANAGIQFRSQKVDEHGQALGYQADVGQEVWGRLYHEHGRGKLDWNARAEEAVKPGEWNRYEILAVGPALWTAVNGKLGVACLDEAGERSGLIAVQIHGGPPQTVHYRIDKLVHDPKVELAGLKAAELITELSLPQSQP